MSLIYFLGGTSNAGKSTCAVRLATRFAFEHIDVDAIRVLLQDAAVKRDPADPIYYFRRGCTWLDLPPEDSLAHKIDVAERTCREGVEPLVEALLIGNRDVIIEGDDLLPDHVARWLAAGATAAAFLIETDDAVVRRRYWDRDGTDCIKNDPGRLELFIPHYEGWVDWLVGDARGRDLAVVDAGPGDPFEEVAEALGLLPG